MNFFKIHIPSHPAIPLLGHYSEEWLASTQEDRCSYVNAKMQNKAKKKWAQSHHQMSVCKCEETILEFQ